MTYQQIIKKFCSSPSRCTPLLVSYYLHLQRSPLEYQQEAPGGLQSIVNASASKEAQVWLQRIVDAPRKLNYTGIFVYSSDGHMETSRVVHMVNNEGEFERIEVLDGSPREVIRNNNEVKRYFPDRKTLVTEKRGLQKFFPALLPKPLSNLNNSYIVKKVGRERISDYECQVIVLEAKDRMRYSQKLWVDVATGLLLKAAVMERGSGSRAVCFYSTRN